MCMEGRLEAVHKGPRGIVLNCILWPAKGNSLPSQTGPHMCVSLKRRLNFLFLAAGVFHLGLNA